MPTTYPHAFEDRAMRMVMGRFEADEDGLTRGQVITEPAPKRNVSIEGLRRWGDQAGVIRGRRPRTTTPASDPDSRPGLVERCFAADRTNRLWAVDITDVRTR